MSSSDSAQKHWGWSGLEVEELTPDQIRVVVTGQLAELAAPDDWVGVISVNGSIDSSLSVSLPPPAHRGRIRIYVQCANQVEVVVRIQRRGSALDALRSPRLEAYFSLAEEATHANAMLDLGGGGVAASLGVVSADGVALRVKSPTPWFESQLPDTNITRDGRIRFQPEPVERSSEKSSIKVTELVAVSGTLLGLISTALAVSSVSFYSHYGVNLSEVGLDTETLAPRAAAIAIPPVIAGLCVYGLVPSLARRRPLLSRFKAHFALLVGLAIFMIQLLTAIPSEDAPLSRQLVFVAVVSMLVPLAIFARSLSLEGRYARQAARLSVVGAFVFTVTACQAIATRLPTDIYTSFGPRSIVVRVFPDIPLVDVRPVEVTAIGTDVRVAIETNHIVDPDPDKPDPAEVVRPSTARGTGYCMGLLGEGNGTYVFITQGSESNGAPNQVLRLPVNAVVIREPLPNTRQIDRYCASGSLVPRSAIPTAPSSSGTPKPGTKGTQTGGK